ncbi:MAG: ABC transporter ATP-binding protein [Kiloniellales bacterium]
MGDIIELAGVTKAFPGGVVAVDDINLSVREGEFVTLLGPSGCGKTTSLRMIAGFEAPDRGRVYLAGKDVTDLPPYRRPVNTVFQDYALFPNMNVAENVGYGLDVAGYSRADAKRRVGEALDLVGLADKAKNRPFKLSGGQRQRVALARALVREPKVLLLDEPLSALDAKLRESMQVELKHLHDRLGLTFVLVTHDQTEALVMSDRIVVMNAGRIEQQGSPSEIYDRPASPYVADFLGASNLLQARIGSTDGDTIIADFDGGRLAALGRGYSSGDPILLCIRPEKVTLHAKDPGEQLGENRLTCQVREHLFHGDAVRVALRCGTAEFFVDVQLKEAMGAASIPLPGETAWATLHPANVIVFPAGGRS